tara:strand:+ start:422 stop:637 length:216 start_codon:yes stop_codon:yes gene_type:complete
MLCLIVMPMDFLERANKCKSLSINHLKTNDLVEKVMVGTGFEPVKAMPADLQSAPVGRLGIPPLLSARAEN